MATNYQQPGEALKYTAATDITSGDPVAFGYRQPAVALVDIDDTDSGNVQLQGVFVFAKNTSDAATEGGKAWWDPSAEEVINAPATGALFLGHFAESALAAATACAVKLAQSFADEGPRLLTLAATGAQSLAAADFYSGDLTVLAPNSAALTLTLPAVADVPTGAKLRVTKTSAAAFAVTLDGNASETVGGSATFATMDANGDTALFVNTGTAWQLLDSAIAAG